jgi:hypothetical protein
MAQRLPSITRRPRTMRFATLTTSYKAGVLAETPDSRDSPQLPLGMRLLTGDKNSMSNGEDQSFL